MSRTPRTPQTPTLPTSVPALLGASLLAAALGLLSVPAAAQTTTVPLGDKDAYIHIHASDTAAPATPLALAGPGAVPGQSLRMKGVGDMDNGPQPDNVCSLIGIFSGSSVLLPPSLLHRVADALDAGPDFVSGNTFTGNEPTDVPEDFRITSAIQVEAIVEIPAGATHLFVGNHDSQWFDNSDPDGDLAVQLTIVGTWKSVGSALAGTAGLPTLTGSGLLLSGDAVTLSLASARPNASSWLIVGFSAANLPFKGGVLVPSPDLVLGPFPTSGAGQLVLPGTWPTGLPGLLTFWFQSWIQDPVGPVGFAASNGVTCLTP
jgi:hypothetical protein